MKPLHIETFNFGAVPHVEIDLTNIGVAVICGPNGGGKSTTFTIAPRFALFGTTKAGTSIDDMIRTGTTEMGVTFDFEHQGNVWRVIRTRSAKGRGKSTLELQRQSGDMWASESGASIAETQKKIIDLLNLDDETFVTSSMILQGRANEFTSRPAGQRKAILTQILQLDQYDDLQEKARIKAQSVNIDLEKAKAKVADIDARLVDKPKLEGDKLDTEIKLRAVETAITQAETDLQAAQVDHAALVARIQQADEIGRQAKEKRADIDAKSAERDRQQQRLDNANVLLDREADILIKTSEYEETKNQVTVLRTKKNQQDSLFNEASRLKSELDGVDKNLILTAQEITRLEDILADRSKLEIAARDYEQAAKDLADYQKLKDTHSQLTLKLTDVQGQIRASRTQYQSEYGRKQQEIAMRTHTASLLDDSQCIDTEKAQCRFLADVKEAKVKAELLKQEFETWNRDQLQTFDQVITQGQEINQQINDCGFDSTEYTRLQELVDELKPKAEAFAKLEGQTHLLENLKTQHVDLRTRQMDLSTRLEIMRAQYKDLSEGLKQLPELALKLTELEPWLKSKEQLPAAKEITATAREIIDRINAEITELTTQALKLDQEYEAIIGDSKGLEEEAANRVKIAREALKKHRDDHTYLTAQLGGISAKLDGLAQDEIARQSLMDEMEPLAKELVQWQTLVKAFGKDGIPALIIENAVPELERIANDILSQMSGGKNYLRFETQRELKSGKGMTETLDIIVGDWAGERIYETFSGGEQLRIDFAIRFALAELLARRAGAKVDWLTIDEGFGSQSDEYLPMVIEAVKNVAHRFGLVLVISHVKAVQEAFEQKIFFRPADEAVEVQVA